MLQGQKCSIYSVRVMDSFLFIQISVAASADRIFAFKVYNTIIAANELYNIVIRLKNNVLVIINILLYFE